MAAKNLLKPEDNDLIPDEGDLDELRKSDLFPEDDGNANPKGLLDPDENDLIPRDGPPMARQLPKVRKKTGDLMDFLTTAAEGGGHGCERVHVELAPGLKASSCPSGGLSIFKNGKQVIDRTELSPDDRQAMNDFLERERNK